MPIYEYRCQSCGHELEKLQRMADAPLTDCPACGQPTLRKLISAAGFRLKGQGWYETDFKGTNKRNVVESGDSKKSAAGASSSSGDSSSGSGGSKSDSAGSKAKSGEKAA